MQAKVLVARGDPEFNSTKTEKGLKPKMAGRLSSSRESCWRMRLKTDGPERILADLEDRHPQSDKRK